MVTVVEICEYTVYVVNLRGNPHQLYYGECRGWNLYYEYQRRLPQKTDEIIKIKDSPAHPSPTQII